MLRELTRSTAVMFALTVSIVLPASTAGASVPDPVVTGEWVVANCAEGNLTGVQQLSGRTVLVLGDAAQCGIGSSSKTSFGIAVYHLENPAATPYMRDYQARYYYAKGARSFGVYVSFEGSREAVCLLSSPTERLACGVLTETTTGSIMFTPLATDHPWVARQAKYGPQDPFGRNESKPECATCF